MVDGNNVTAFEHYHERVLGYLQSAYSDRIRDQLHARPSEVRRAFFQNLPQEQVFTGDEAWSHAKAYADRLETLIATTLRPHSAFFWLHLYRRIGVTLSPLHEDKTD